MRHVWTMFFAGALLSSAASVAAAGPLTVAEFLAKADALRAQGMLAIGSPDIALLRDTVKGAGESYRAEITAAKAGGKKPRACPPPPGQAKVDSKAIMADFRAIPPARRNITVKAAFYRMMDKRFPCPA